MLFLWRGLSFGLWSQSSLNWVKQVARKMIPLPRTGKFSLECYDSSAHRPTSQACFFLYPNQTGVHTRQYGLDWGFAPAWTLDSGLKASEGKNPRFSWFYPKWVLAPFWAFSSPPNQPQRELAPLASLRQPQLINVKNTRFFLLFPSF